MRQTIVPFGRTSEHVKSDTADRTAIRDLGGSFHSATWGMAEVKVFASRDAMARTIRKQESKHPVGTLGVWRAVVPLKITEGY